MQEKTLPNQANSTFNIHSSECGAISYDIFGNGAADILIKYGQDNGYSNRRNDEAKLLQELSKQKTSTAN